MALANLTVTSLAIEIGVPSFTFILTSIYVTWVLYLEPKGKNKAKATHSIMLEARRQWIADQHMKGVVPANTFRDYMNAGEFLASTAMTLAVAIFGFTISGTGACVILDVNTCSDMDILVFCKQVVISLHFFVIFFFFSQQIRYCTHVSIMMNTSRIGDQMLQPDDIFVFFRRAVNFWTIGIRGFYFSVPLMLWLLSPWANLGATLVMLFIFYSLDHTSPIFEEKAEEKKNKSGGDVEGVAKSSGSKPLLSGETLSPRGGGHSSDSDNERQ